MSIVSRSTQQYSGFDPRSIPGCQLWLDGADRNTLTFNGVNVTEWRDKTSNNNHASRTTSSLTWNNNGIVFPGNNQGFLQFPTSFTALQSIFVVYNMTSATGPIFGSTSEGNGLFPRFGNFYLGTVNGWLESTTLFYTLNTTSVISITTSPTNVHFEGISRYTSGSMIAWSSPRYLGARIASSVNYYTGTIHEFIVYDNSLTTAQRQAVEGYLAHKWGLQSNIPTSHPFRSTPVFTRPFQPVDIDGLQLWLDAADATTVTRTTNVTNVRDKSPNGVVLSNANGFSYPNNTFNGGYPSFLMSNTTSASTLGVNTSFALATPFTVFFVAQRTDPGTPAGFLLDSGGSSGLNRPFIWDHNTPNVWVTANITTNTSSRTPTIGVTTFGSSPIFFANGTSVGTTTTASTFTTGGITVGNRFSLNNSFGGHICEFLIYSGSITIAQRQQVEGYLAAKWGLSTALPPAFSAVSTLFDPRTISGCQLWLDAADPAGTGVVPVNGASVSTWVDKSGNARNVSGTNAVTYSSLSNELVFNGTNTLLSNTTNIPTTTQNYPVFVVFRPTVTTRGRLIEVRVNGQIPLVQLDTTFITSSTASSNSYVGPLTVSANTRVLYESFANTTTDIRYAINGVVNNNWAANEPTTAQTTNSFLVGGFSTQSVMYSGGINEILMFNRYLTTSERQTIEGYLYAKWNIPVPRHPYYRMQSLPATPIFTPTSLSGLALWLDAADPAGTGVVPVNGSAISTWVDKSPNALSGTSTGSPTISYNLQNNLPGITFNGSTQFFNFGAPNALNLGTNQLYIFAVSKFNSTAGGTILGKSRANAGLGRYSLLRLSGALTPLIQGTNISVVNNNGIADTNTSTRLLTMTWDRTTINLLQNGTSVFSTALADSGSATNSDVFLVGAYPNSSGTTPPSDGFYFNGNIHEIIVYLGTLTASQRQQVEGYLAAKWNVAVPTAHPYKNFRP